MPPLASPVGAELRAGLEFLGQGRRLVLIRRTGPAAARPEATWEPEATSWRLLPFGAHVPADSIVSLLRNADTLRLRAMLAHEESFVHRLDDHRVRDAVAQLVRQGRIRLFERLEAAVPVPPPRPHAEKPAPLPALPLPAEGVTPKAWLGRAAPAPAPRAPVSVPSDPVQALDQDAQAAVLSNASRQGVPFCEECARRAAMREELEPA